MKFTRSTSVDIFFTKDRERHLSQHLKKIHEIKLHHEDHQQTIQKVKKISNKLHKARETARMFKIRQDTYHRSQQDKKMIKNITEMQPTVNFGSHFKAHKAHKAHRKRETTMDSSPTAKAPVSVLEYIIQSQRKKLASGIKSQQFNTKEYKKKLVTEIGEYIKLRQHMQRFKTISSERSPSYRSNCSNQRKSYNSNETLKPKPTLSINLRLKQKILPSNDCL